jgi:hypothetical protein
VRDFTPSSWHSNNNYRSRGPITAGWDSLLHGSEPEASLGEDPHFEVTCIFIFRILYAKNTKKLQNLKIPKIFICFLKLVCFVMRGKNAFWPFMAEMMNSCSVYSSCMPCTA